MTRYHQPEQLNEIPPIVLLVGDDPDARDMYTALLETSGFWVAAAADADTAFSSVSELRPNLILTDIGGSSDGAGRTLDFVETVKLDEGSHGIPVLMLSTRTAEELPRPPQNADALLVKPVLPEVLLLRVRELIATSRQLRDRSDVARQKGHALAQQSARLIERSIANAERVDVRNRRCPDCRRMLEWIDRGTIGAIEYDYYGWCAGGCGLYCLNRGNGAWIKLA